MTDPLAGRLSFAFVLGGLTFFAPCAYPLLPGYLAYFLGQTDDGEPSRRSVLGPAGFGLQVSLGFLVVYAVLGGVVLTVGTELLADLVVLELVVGLLLVVLGLAMAAGRTPTVRVSLPRRRRSALGFLLFGVVYAVAAAGCTAALSFAVVASAVAADPLVGLWTLLAYVAGMSGVMLLVTVLAGLGRDAVLRRLSARTGQVERVAGALLVLAGVAQVSLFLFRFGGLRTLGFA